MKHPTRFINADRRRFIQNTTVVSGAVVAGVAATSIRADAGLAQDTATAGRGVGHAGYRLTDKVREYYRKARY